MIQFPWRILGFQVLFGSLILSFVFMKSTSAKQRKVVNITAIVLLLLAVSAATKANYEHKVVTQRDHLVMNQENLIRYTTLFPEDFMTMHPRKHYNTKNICRIMK